MALESSPDLVAQVIAWHHRNPLARRIGAPQVQGMGWVSLPFAAPVATGGDSAADPETPPGQTLRERALARAQAEATAEPPAPAAEPRADPFSGPVQAAFSEDLLPPCKPAAMARFALAEGRRTALTVADRPVREALVDPRLVPPGWGPAWLHLRTAAIEVGASRTRVLVSAEGKAVLGARLLSPRRVALAIGLPVLLVAAAAWWWSGAVPSLPGPQKPASAPSASAAPASPLPAASSNSLPAAVPSSLSGSSPVAASGAPPGVGTGVQPPPAATPAAEPKPAPDAATAAVSAVGADGAAAAVAPASPPSSAVATAPSAPAPSAGPPSIRPRLDPETARAARRESSALRAASAASATAAGPATAVAPTPSPQPGRGASAPVAGNRVFALVARTTKSRAASAVLLGAMIPEAGSAPGSPRAEVLPADGGFRASLWPFASRAQAERVQRRLREGGLETELVEF